ncbi:SAM-dependent methyltransferase [Bowdeniella nasicola]|uniref:tRNA (adenine(58)-N(1))-methyltransferase TrmI n=2 Tax=Bowdeniella nasicola TaxID=208480 RepID=A0A1Q5Q501_9ACTO|nr:tRNA (adenine-N1)-methyltransferase [Bowdeniella nasicola]OKL54863.1 SAM-dependent methyltransferase [Bowdeniella nasicola]
MAGRRGPIRAGERVQLTDYKGKVHTIVLHEDGHFHSHRGSFAHAEIIGCEDGSVITTSIGYDYLVLRPLLTDYVLGMPRGAAVIYPKDAALIIGQADIFPGATVVEAGVGSGALSMSLLRAIGEGGRLISVERRADFAEIARLNVDQWFGRRHPAWDVREGDLADVLFELEERSVDRIVLDMLAPWENIDAASHALIAGGLILAYVATTTQLSRFVEELRDTEGYTEPRAFETMLRTWHLEGLAVRPDHRMVGHTGFLVTARKLAPGTLTPRRHRRPAKGAYAGEGVWDPAELGEKPVAERKIRRVTRDLKARGEFLESLRRADET